MGDDAESNLEMRCSADEAWYDGTLRVSPESKDLIVVHFNDFDEEEDETFHRSELRDPAKLRSRVRVRSVQLQDSQCRRVYEGQKICGCLDDGEDRKYYDAEVTSIAKRTHSFKDDGEECLCQFTVFWLDGPRKRENTVVGCAEVCFLSTESPEEDPMVKNLLKSLAGHGDQPRRKLVKSVPESDPKSVSTNGPKSAAKSVLSPRPRTPSPSLELAPSKKQSSREPSPPADVPNQKVPELARTKSLPIGSKKKRIMQAEEQQLTDCDKLEMDGRGIRAPKDSSHRSGEGDEAEATGPGDESVAPERRVLSGASEPGKKGSVQDGEQKRVVKGKAKVGTPEVIDRDEAARDQDDMQDIVPGPTGIVKERLKLLNTKKMATSVKAGRQESNTIVTQSLAERVKLKTAQKNPDAAPDAAAAASASAATARDEAIKQDNIVQSLGERVKLKIAQSKNPSVSPVDAHKDSLQKIGKQFVRKQVIKRKLIQLEDPSPDSLKSKFDKVVKPKTTSNSKEVAAKASSIVEPSNVEPSSVEQEQPKVQKRRAGRPRKRPLSEPSKSETESTVAKKQQVGEISSEQKQSPREEEMVEASADKCASHPPNMSTKKRPRDAERLQHASDDIVSDSLSQEEETLGAHVRKQSANKRKRKKLITLAAHDDTVSDKSAHTNNLAEDDPEDHSPSIRDVDEAMKLSCHMENKVSIAEKFRDIQNKFHNGSTLSTPQAAEELLSLARYDLFPDVPTEDQQNMASSPFDNSGSHLQTGDEAGASGRRRRVGKRQLVITDDEVEDVAVPSEGKQHGSHGSDDAVDQCSPMSDPKNAGSALDEEVVVPNQGGPGVAETRLLMLENMETDASALDAMQLLHSNTEGVCAVHVLPVLEFQVSATGYALYRDSGSALKALRWLTSLSRFVVSPNGRPWIVSQAKEVYGPSLCGFATQTAYKSYDPGMCGIISDQPHTHDLVVVTKRDNGAYFKAQQMSKSYVEHKKWQKELYERIVQHEKMG